MPTRPYMSPPAAPRGALFGGSRSAPPESRFYVTHFFVAGRPGVQMAYLADMDSGPSGGDVRKRILVEEGVRIGPYEVGFIDPDEGVVELIGADGWHLIKHCRESELFTPRGGSSRRRVLRDEARAFAEDLDRDCEGVLATRVLRLPSPDDGEDYFTLYADDLSAEQRESIVSEMLARRGLSASFIPSSEMGYGSGWTLFRTYSGDELVSIEDLASASPSVYGSSWSPGPDRAPGVHFEYEVGGHRFSYKGDSAGLAISLGFAAFSAWVSASG